MKRSNVRGNYVRVKLILSWDLEEQINFFLFCFFKKSFIFLFFLVTCFIPPSGNNILQFDIYSAKIKIKTINVIIMTLARMTLSSIWTCIILTRQTASDDEEVWEKGSEYIFKKTDLEIKSCFWWVGEDRIYLSTVWL